MVEDSSVVAGASLAEVVAPVPTTCRLGMIPAGIESAPICEKPKNRENMMAIESGVSMGNPRPRVLIGWRISC